MAQVICQKARECIEKGNWCGHKRKHDVKYDTEHQPCTVYPCRLIGMYKEKNIVCIEVVSCKN